MLQQLYNSYRRIMN